MHQLHGFLPLLVSFRWTCTSNPLCDRVIKEKKPARSTTSESTHKRKRGARRFDDTAQKSSPQIGSWNTGPLEKGKSAFQVPFTEVILVAQVFYKLDLSSEFDQTVLLSSSF